MNLKTKQKGFTLVELLIVIVVIAILAAISIVAYNGIQNRAKTTSAAASAATVAKKAEAANAVKSAYPLSTGTATGGFAEQSDSDLAGSGVELIALASLTSSAKTSQVTYEKCATASSGAVPNLARVDYWNYTKNAKQSAVPTADGGGYLYLGGNSAGTCATWTVLTGGPF